VARWYFGLYSFILLLHSAWSESNREALTSNTRNLGHRAVKKAHISERNRDIGAKNGKPPLYRNWWNLVHIFQHFWKALRQAYMTQKFCGSKFKNGGDMAMGAKNRKTPTFKKKLGFFAQKICLTLEKNICVQKDYFRERKNLRGRGDPPIFFLLKIRFLERPLERFIFANYWPQKNRFLGSSA